MLQRHPVAVEQPSEAGRPSGVTLMLQYILHNQIVELHLLFKDTDIFQ
jgi:hypothetical protein